jgi:hypothetical protein
MVFTFDARGEPTIFSESDFKVILLTVIGSNNY